MSGRFTARRVTAPELPAIEEPAPSALAGASCTVLPEVPAEQAPPVQPQAAVNPLLSDKLLDAKVRLRCWPVARAAQAARPVARRSVVR